MNLKPVFFLPLAFVATQASIQVSSQAQTPKTAAPNSSSLRIRIIKENGAEKYLLEAKNKSLGDILEAVATAAGHQISVPEILKTDRSVSVTRSFYSLDTMLENIMGFDKRLVLFKSGDNLRIAILVEKVKAPDEAPKASPEQLPKFGPFFDPHFLIPKFDGERGEPKNYRDKFSFNGGDVYLIPVPSTLSPSAPAEKQVSPLIPSK
ncbi:hypothetical protein EON80_10820 [bacterium]|nr:MAG: hypothetical protein EON80_10820 [bacterium]